MSCKHENGILYAVVADAISGCTEGCCGPVVNSYMQKVCEACRSVLDSREYYESTFSHPEELFTQGEEK